MAAQKLPAEPDALYVAIEPILRGWSRPEPDLTALRALLPAPAAKVTKRRALVLDGALVTTGSLSIEGGLEMVEGAGLVVLGDLTVRGGMWSPLHGYSFLVVGGALDVDRACTSGDVVAFGGARFELYWAAGNDHSTFAPTLRATTYVTDDRNDIAAIEAPERIDGSDRDDVQARFGIDLDEDGALRRLIGGPKDRAFRPNEPKHGELAALAAALDAAWAIPERIPRVRRIREVYGDIKKRKLAAAGEILVAEIGRKHRDAEEWSIQDELELLAALRRADLLESLPPEQIGGWENWMPGLIGAAKKR